MARKGKMIAYASCAGSQPGRRLPDFRTRLIHVRCHPPRAASRRARDSRRLRLPRSHARQRHRAREEAALGRAHRDVPAHVDRRLRVRRRPAARTDGQFRGRAPQHRRRPRRLPGLHANRPRDRNRRVRAQSGAARRRRRAPAPAARRCTCSVSLSPGGVHSHERQIAAMVELAAARRRAAHPRARVPRRPRYAAAKRGRVARAAGRRVRAPSGRAHRFDRRPLLRDGSRPALGARRARPTTCWSTVARPTPRHRRRPALAAAYARGETDEFVQRHGDRRPGRRARDHRRRRCDRLHELPRRSRATAHARAHRSVVRRLPAPPHAAARDVRLPHELRRRVRSGCPSRFRRNRSRTASARTSPRSASRSCASPRPRSTRTSPISSAAASRRRIRARTACSCRRPRWRPTISSRK